jgi:hypothetical protein
MQLRGSSGPVQNDMLTPEVVPRTKNKVRALAAQAAREVSGLKTALPVGFVRTATNERTNETEKCGKEKRLYKLLSLGNYNTVKLPRTVL